MPVAPLSSEWFDPVEHVSYPAAAAASAISFGLLKIG
jgi:hypothetical protein